MRHALYAGLYDMVGVEVAFITVNDDLGMHTHLGRVSRDQQ